MFTLKTGAAGRRRLWPALTAAAITTTVLVVTCASPVNAAVPTDRRATTTLEEVAAWDRDSTAWLAANKPLAKAPTSSLMKALEKQVQQRHNVLGDAQVFFALQRASAYRQGTGNLVTVPITGATVVQGSFAAFALDKWKRLTSVDHLVLRDIGAPDRGRLTVVRDGAVVTDVVVSEARESAGQARRAGVTSEETRPITTMGWSWKKFKNCLNNMGVASWAITAITIACGFACPSTGPGCLLCLVAASYVTQGVVTYCFGKAFT